MELQEQDSSFTIRPIAQADNPLIAKIIRSTLEEFGANKPGTVYFDDTTDHLFELFETEGAGYFMARFLLNKSQHAYFCRSHAERRR